MKYLLILLLFTLVTFASCHYTAHRDVIDNRIDSLDLVLDTMLLRSTELNRQLQLRNKYLDSAIPHQEKSVQYLKKYYASYNDRYYRLYKLHNDSFQYYLQKSIRVK